MSAVGDIEAPEVDVEQISRAEVDAQIVRCPDAATAERMEARVKEVLAAKDSTGGILTCVCRNVPVGLGEPVFDKLEARLAQAMLSLPATKGFDIGSGFAGTRMRGSGHNDPFVRKGERLGTRTNYSGGVQGGISNGEPVVFRVAFKPVATIGMAQETVDFDGDDVVLGGQGPARSLRGAAGGADRRVHGGPGADRHGPAAAGPPDRQPFLMNDPDGRPSAPPSWLSRIHPINQRILDAPPGKGGLQGPHRQ